jgi:23S rRNA pseudouridine2605 synthase
VIKVKGQMKEKDLKHWSKGVELEDGMTHPAVATMLRHEEDKTWLELTIKEGRNQQIRRMGEATGFPVMRLARTAFAGVTSEGLRPGTWRLLTPTELTTLKKAYGVPRAIPARGENAQASRSVTPRRHAAPLGVRGRSEREPERNDAPRAELGRGRGASRTTGTGGGIGASQDGEGYRLSRRRGG